MADHKNRLSLPSISPDPKRVNRLRSFLDEIRSCTGKRLLYINWKSRFSHKDAPPELAFEIARRLADQYHAVFFKDRSVADVMEQEVNACGALIQNLSHLINDLHDTIAAISLVDAIISVDTGVVHAAGALSVPGVALFGPFPPETHVSDYPSIIGVRSNYQGSKCKGPCEETHRGCAEIGFVANRISPCFEAITSDMVIETFDKAVKFKAHNVTAKSKKGLRMKKILIIQLSRMGDLVQTLPLLKRLKQEKPGCEISLMCVREFSEVIRDSRLADRLIHLSLEDVIEALKPDDQVNLSRIDHILEIPELREEYDFVINLTHTSGSGHICERVNAKKKAGRINANKGEVRLSGDWAKYLFAFSRNRTENLFNLVDMYVGMGGVSHKPVEDYLKVTSHDSDKAYALLKANGYEEKGCLIAFQMGANKPHRAWPVNNFVSLANQLIKRADVEIVLLGSEKERETGEQFLSRADFPVIDLIGKTDLADLPAIIKECDLIVSNDTGPIHISAAVRTKVLGLYFSTACFSETAPYGEGNVIIQAELPCSPCHEREMCEEMECREYLNAEAAGRVAEMILDGKNDLRFDFPNLSVYQSKFLSNGSLVYAPISSTISEHYQVGFVNRIMWEAAFGLAHDRSFIDGLMPGIRVSDGFVARVERYRKGLNCLVTEYSLGIKAAGKIIKEFVKRPISQARILSIADKLGKIEANISKLEGLPGMMKDFHNLK
ncbi:MAG: hypothetical protein JRE23_09590 [Deltaproteobacteria bacterium]|nr:hypothetical protein [Deltaproteobacteria bacterium]